MDSSGDGGDEGAGAAPAGVEEESPAPASPPAPAPASASAPVPAAVGGGAGASGSSGKVKRVMKTPYQLEVLERTYTGSWMMAYGGLGILEIFRAISCLICRFFDRNSPVISVLTWFCLCCCRGSVSK
jgi:hypothetical protein